jgi:hypothetical protein
MLLFYNPQALVAIGGKQAATLSIVGAYVPTLGKLLTLLMFPAASSF